MKNAFTTSKIHIKEINESLAKMRLLVIQIVKDNNTLMKVNNIMGKAIKKFM
jgi:hypothetical protein